jgi:DNA-binding response OmpR family regulator
MKLLLVEDDPEYVDLIGTLLGKRGWDIDAVPDPGAAVERARENDINLVMLDAGLRGSNGGTLTREIRRATMVPIVVMVEAGAPAVGEALIEDGANFDLVKPFTPRRLRAAIRAVFSPGGAASPAALPEEVEVGGLKIGLVRHEVTVDGKQVALSPREFAVFHVLLANPGRTFARKELADLAWGPDPTRTPRLIDVYIGYLRRKIEPDPKKPQFILTARGAGYLWAPSAN